MSAKKTVVKVTIFGDEYSIRSDETPEHTRAVAAYLDAAIRKVMGTGSVIESHKAAILAAMQITDELFKAREAADAVAGRMKDLSADVRRWLPPNKRQVATPEATAIAFSEGEG